MLEAIEKTALLPSQLIVSILDQMEATLEHARGRIKWYNKEVNEAICWGLPKGQPLLNILLSLLMQVFCSPQKKSFILTEI